MRWMINDHWSPMRLVMTTPSQAVTKKTQKRDMVILFSSGGFSWEDTLVIDPDDLSQSPLWNLKTLRLSSRPSPIAPTVNTVIGSLLGHSHTKTRAKCHRVDDEHFHLENLLSESFALTFCQFCSILFWLAGLLRLFLQFWFFAHSSVLWQSKIGSFANWQLWWIV